MSGPNSAIIRQGRQFHESIMTSECTITRITGKTLDDDTGRNVDTVETLYTGKCKIRIAAASAGILEREPLGQSFALQESILSLPVAEGTGMLLADDRVLITSNPDDPELVGLSWRIKKYSSQTSATQRRLVVEDVG